MKKIIILLVFFIFAIGLTFFSNDRAFTLSEEKGAHTFASQEEMAKFEQLYAAKQATFNRMGVLQAYFVMEQRNLQQIDQQTEGSFGFKVDLNKRYVFDRDSLEVKEEGFLLSQDTMPPTE